MECCIPVNGVLIPILVRALGSCQKLFGVEFLTKVEDIHRLSLLISCGLAMAYVYDEACYLAR